MDKVQVDWLAVLSTLSQGETALETILKNMVNFSQMGMRGITAKLNTKPGISP